MRAAGAGGGQAQVQMRVQMRVAGAVAMLSGTWVQHHLGRHEYTGTTHGSQSYTLLLPGSIGTYPGTFLISMILW